MLTEKQKQILDLLGNTLYQYMEKNILIKIALKKSGIDSLKTLAVSLLKNAAN